MLRQHLRDEVLTGAPNALSLDVEAADEWIRRNASPRVTQGTGGVSLFAAQMATAMGAEVIVLSGDEDTLARVKALGAAHGIHRRHTPESHAAVLDLTRAVDRAALKPVVDTVYSLDALPTALEHLDRGSFDKRVITA